MGIAAALLVALAAAQNPKIETSIHLEYAALEKAEPFEVVIRMVIEDPWHVYWINPGDSGVPTTVKWKLPDGWKAEPLRFPVPRKFATSSGTAYGHQGEVHFMARITPAPDANGRFDLAADMAWLACKETCIPGSASLKTDIEIGGAPSKIIGSAFDSARETQPKSGLVAKASRVDKGIQLRIDGAFSGGYFFAEDGDAVSSAAAQPLKTISSGIELSLTPSEYAKEFPKRLKGVLVLDSADAKGVGYAIDIPVEPQ